MYFTMITAGALFPIDIIKLKPPCWRTVLVVLCPATAQFFFSLGVLSVTALKGFVACPMDPLEGVMRRRLMGFNVFVDELRYRAMC